MYFAGVDIGGGSRLHHQTHGVSNLFPTARTIIHIGGQHAKGIRILAGGKVVGFVMNDKCAAGTGRFIEVIAAKVSNLLDKVGMGVV